MLARALTLASMEVSWLGAVQVTGDGSLAQLAELDTQIGPEQIAECEVILTAQLLGLLVEFIGEKLTVRLVREVWPKVAFNDFDHGKGVKNEITN